MPKLTIVAQLTVNADKIDLVKAEMQTLAKITRTEAGCIQYDIHQDNADPTFFLIFENWESYDLWQEHMAAPHLKAYRDATAGAVVSATINQMTHII